MVERPEQYRWSSAAAHLCGEKDPSRVLDMSYGSGQAAPGLGRKYMDPRKITANCRPSGTAHTPGGRSGMTRLSNRWSDASSGSG